MEKRSRWEERKTNDEELLKVEKAAAGEESTFVATGLLGGTAEPLRPGHASCQ